MYENVSLESLFLEARRNEKKIQEFRNLMAITSSMEGAVGIARSSGTFLSSAFDKVSDFFGSIFNKSAEPTFQFKEASELDKEIKRNLDVAIQAYSSKYNTEIPYITSCTVDILTLARLVSKCANDYQKVVKEIAIEADTVISKAMTSEEFRTSSRPYKPSTAYNKAKEWIKSVEDFKERSFDYEKRSDVEELGKVLPNVNSLKEVWDIINNCSKTLNTEELKKLQKEVNSISLKADALASELGSGAYVCGPEASSTLTDIISLAAESVTHVSIVQHSLNQLVLAYISIGNELLNK